MSNYQEEKQIAKLKIGNQYFFRITHLLGEMATGITIYKLARTPLTKEDYTLTELTPMDVSEKLQKELFSNEHQVEVTKEDTELLTQAFAFKYEHLKAIAKKNINQGTKRQMLSFIEVEGLFFAQIFEWNMPYPKVYHLAFDVVQNKVRSAPVPAEILPAIAEALAPTIFNNQRSLIIQVDEGVYARISRTSPKEALVIVVVAQEGEEKEEANLQLSLAFLLKSEDEENWFAAHKDGSEKEFEKKIEESFDYLYTDLLIKLYERRGSEALEQ